jgi:hypothetical protein
VRGRAWPFLVVLAAVAAPAAADAARHPPPAELRGNGQSRVLAPWSSFWAFPAPPDACAEGHGDGVPSYEPRIEVAHPHAQPRIAILRDRRPRVRGFRAYAELNENGFAKGHGKPIEFRVRPKRRNGKVAGWRIVFRVNVAARPYFDVRLNYKRRRGPCHEGGGASYAFGIAHE